MPGFDGTGPQSQGPMTGRGEGYCALPIPRPGETRQGYVGIQGTPVSLRPARPLGGAFRRGRGWRRGRGRGRRFYR